MKNILTFLFLFSTASPQDSITMSSELSRLLEIKNLPGYINNSTVNQVSSYDRKGGNNDGFEGTYSFISRNADSTLLVFEAAGKGVIERIWTPTPTNDTLDFYFDGAAKPSYSIKFNDLYSGKVYPFINPVAASKVGGWYSYLPIPYANGCKIILRGKKMLFYQIQYRTYTDPAVAVKTFSPVLAKDADAILQKIKSLWSMESFSSIESSSSSAGSSSIKSSSSIETESKSNQPVKPVEKQLTLIPGTTTVLANITAGGRLTNIELGSAKSFEGLSNSVDIRITWDGEKSAAVYAPVEDLFGYAFGAVSMKSLLMGVDNDIAYCNIPMPFDRSAKVELIYRKAATSQKPLKIKTKVSYSAEKRKPGEGKFYAFWKRESPALGAPYVFLEGNGKGHYIGTLLLSQGRDYTYFTEFFEGDDSTVLDDKNLLHGTGSEDYFNGGWYAQPGGWVERKGAPLHGCLDYSLPYSRTGGYRFYVLDKLPFQQRIFHSMEHGPEKNNREVEYTSVAMYYADKPIATGKAPDNRSSGIFIPDTVSFYTRLMNHITYEGEAKLVHGNAELAASKKGGINIDVTELSKGKYKMYMYGRFTLDAYATVEGGSGGSGRQLINKNIKDDEEKNYFLGSFEITDTSNPVKVDLEAGSRGMIFNRIYFVKQ